MTVGAGLRGAEGKYRVAAGIVGILQPYLSVVADKCLACCGDAVAVQKFQRGFGAAVSIVGKEEPCLVAVSTDRFDERLELAGIALGHGAGEGAFADEIASGILQTVVVEIVNLCQHISVVEEAAVGAVGRLVAETEFGVLVFIGFVNVMPETVAFGIEVVEVGKIVCHGVGRRYMV